MRTIGAEEQQIIEAEAVQAGIPTLLLMEQAARAVADLTLKLLSSGDYLSVSILCGAGNNGGDGYAAARLLLDCVPDLRLYESASAADNQGDARLNRQACLKLGMIPHPLQEFTPRPGLIIDAVFGSGFKADRPVDPEFRSLAMAVNTARTHYHACVLSVDLPSGIEASSGRASESVITADETLTFILPKIGLVSYPGRKFAGRVTVSNLGLPASFLEKTWIDKNLHSPSALTESDVRSWKPERAPDRHKGSFGRLAILAGSPGLAGAAILSGQAAIRTGTGYVYLTVPSEIYPAVLAAAPSLLTSALPNPTSEEHLRDASISARRISDTQLAFWRERMQGMDAVLVGPGLGLPDAARPDLINLVLAAIREAPRLVLDADALNLLAVPDNLETYREVLQQRMQSGLEPAILTPHPGEFARLCPEAAGLVEQDRIRSARLLAKLTNSVVVLKGAGTIMVFPADSETWINTSGNVGMAKAGSGDVLSGLLGALLAQGLPLRQAVLSAVFLHGLAADIQSKHCTYRALAPEGTLAGLPAAFRQVGWED